MRPKAVSIVAAFLFVATAIAAIVATSLLLPNTFLDRIWELNRPASRAFHTFGPVSGAFLLALGGGVFATGIGLLRRQPWAWWFAVVLFAIDGLGDIVSFLATGEFLRSLSGAIVSIAFVWTLCRHRVRDHFKE